MEPQLNVLVVVKPW